MTVFLRYKKKMGRAGEMTLLCSSSSSVFGVWGKERAFPYLVKPSAGVLLGVSSHS